MKININEYEQTCWMWLENDGRICPIFKHKSGMFYTMTDEELNGLYSSHTIEGLNKMLEGNNG